MPYAIREDVRKLRTIQAESKLCARENIETYDDLSAYRQSIEQHIATLKPQQSTLNNARRRAKYAGQQPDQLTQTQLTQVNTQLQQLRKEVRLCDGIRTRAYSLKAKVDEIAQQPVKEVNKWTHHQRQQSR
jgi:hypothetical protein